MFIPLACNKALIYLKLRQHSHISSIFVHFSIDVILNPPTLTIYIFVLMEIGHVILVLSIILPSHVHGKLKIQAIYQFGDSISDTGNLIREGSNGANSPFAKLPYGQTYFHIPTGRCSDGLLIIDYFGTSIYLIYSCWLMAYLDIHLSLHLYRNNSRIIILFFVAQFYNN